MPEPVAVVTHAVRDEDELARGLAANGWRVIAMPCVTIEHLNDPSPLEAAVAALDVADWLVVTSPSGADALARVTRTRSRVAAIGESTARRLRGHGIAVHFVPTTSSGAALASELPTAPRALLARSDRALPDAPRILRERGFAVTEVVAYRTRVGATGDIASVRAALASDDARVAFYIESPSALEGLRAAIEPDLLARGVITHVAHR